VLAFSHWKDIGELAASDIDADSLAVAARNLSLLTFDGLQQRTQEIERLISLYGKASHHAALTSAAVLKQKLAENLAGHSITPRLFQADVLQPEAIRAALGGYPADLVISDLPYGLKSAWQASAPGETPEDPIRAMLATLAQVLAPQAVLAIITTRQNKVAHPGYTQVGKLKLGLRVVTFLKLVQP
jgi:hypothetical protein